MSESPEAAGYCVILTTAGSQDEADRLASGLVENKLAACVQITNVTSYYTWEGSIQHEPELLLLIKTSAHLYAAVEAFLHRSHSYAVPEIVQIPIQRGLAAYLNWIDESMTG